MEERLRRGVTGRGAGGGAGKLLNEAQRDGRDRRTAPHRSAPHRTADMIASHLLAYFFTELNHDQAQKVGGGSGELEVGGKAGGGMER